MRGEGGRARVRVFLLWTAVALVVALPAHADPTAPFVTTYGRDIGAQANASCVVKITRFEWVPRLVHPGDRTRLWLGARNCTQETLELTVTEYGEQIPPCPVIDPIGSQVVLDPLGRYAPPPFRMVAPPCDGVETMVVTFTDSQGSVARATATVRIAP